MTTELSKFIDPSPSELAEQWRSISARVMWAGTRQVNFVPCEVVLALCASRIVDHRRFGSSSAERAPSPVPELARLFKRPPSSILAKMANLDGIRSNGGRYDRQVYAHLGADSDALDGVYRRIISAARAENIGPNLLPDFLGLTGDAESPQLRASSYPEVRRYDGVDGQVLIAEEYVWITRENLEPEVWTGFPTEPRRAPLGAVRACRLERSQGERPGRIHIRVEGADELVLTEVVRHPDVVSFGSAAAEEFSALARLLDPSFQSVTDAGRMATPPSDRFLEALDRLSGLATVDEIVADVALQEGLSEDRAVLEGLTDELDELDNHPGITWGWVSENWVAAGGREPAPGSARKEQLGELGRLTARLGGDAGIRKLTVSRVGTTLEAIPTSRFAQLWESLDPATLVDPPAPVTEPADPPVMNQSRHRVKTLGAPAGEKSAVVGRQWRVCFDCEGFRTIAVCDPIAGQITITRGELEGRRFPNPDVAAAAILERHSPGGSGSVDGWELWLLHDGSGRSVGSVRGRAPSLDWADELR